MPGKTSKKDKTVCTEHVVSMRARNQNCYFSQAVSMDLCSKGTGSYRGKKNPSSCYEGPVFNRDKNFSTPTFILASEKVQLTQCQKNFQPTNLKTMIEIDRRYSSYDCEKSLIFVPKPNSKSMYCSVCKERYEDYLQHVGTDRHRHNIRNNTFTKYIYEQADTYQQNKTLKSPPTATDTSNVIVISSDSEGCVPRKKVKRCPDFEENTHKNTPRPQMPQFVNPLQYLPNGMGYMNNYPMHFNFNYNINLMGMPGVFNSLPMNYMGGPINYPENFPHVFPKAGSKKNFIIVEDDKQ